jgi:hypothetical protein
MKNGNILLLLALIVCTACKSNAQTDNTIKFTYKIDAPIANIIAKKKITSNTATAAIATIKNDTIEKFPIMTMEGMPCYTLAFLKGDTIKMVIMPMFIPGHGVIEINFFKDTAIATCAYAPKDGEPRFKNLKEDKQFQKSIVVQAKLCRITLAEKPTCNGKIQGFIEYESKDYFIRDGNGLIRKAYKFKAFFNSECKSN